MMILMYIISVLKAVQLEQGLKLVINRHITSADT